MLSQRQRFEIVVFNIDSADVSTLSNSSFLTLMSSDADVVGYGANP